MEIFAGLVNRFWRYAPLKPKSILPAIHHSLNLTSLLIIFLTRQFIFDVDKVSFAKH